MPSTESEELAREPALADAGLSVDREEVRPLVAQRPGERVLEELDLGVPADERGVGRALDRRSVGRERGPRPHRVLAASDLHRADVVDFDVSEREAVHGRADQDLARLRDLLQAGGQVDRLAGGEGRVARVCHDLAGLDADPRLEVEVLDRLEDPECRLDGALGVVLVRLRDAEGGHDGVARELLDLPAVRLDAARHLVEEPGHAPAHDLGVARGDERRRVDEVDEQNRCEFSFQRPTYKNVQEGV